MKYLILLALLPFTAYAAEGYRHAQLVHAPELAETQPAQSEEGMIVYIDPATGEFRATPPAGVRAAEFPELMFDPSLIVEETRPDGTVTTWLNGAGREAQVLRVGADGVARLECSSVMERGRIGDLRQAGLEARRRHDR